MPKAEYVRSNLRVLFMEYNLDRLRSGKPELTQQQFGDLLGIDRATINRWMTSKPLEYRKLEYKNNKVMGKLLKELDVTKEQLLTPVDKSNRVVKASLEEEDLAGVA